MPQRMDLPGHFKRIAIDRIVPTLDIDGAGPAGEAQFGDDVGPVAVAEARRAHEDVRVLAENAVLADHVPADGGVLAVHVEDLVRPFANLGQRIDEVDHLVAGLPFEPDIVLRRLVEDQLPGIRIVRNVPVAGLPIAVHGAVFEGDANALVGGALRQLGPDRLVLRQALGQRLAPNAAGKAGHARGAEMVGIVDAILPALQGLAVHLLVFERIAEHTEGRDGDVAIPDRVLAALAELGDVLPIGGLPEERLETFKALIGDFGDALGGFPGRCRNHGADADGFCRVAHLSCPRSMVTRWPRRALSIAAKTMARLLMLSVEAVSG